MVAVQQYLALELRLDDLSRPCVRGILDGIVQDEVDVIVEAPQGTDQLGLAAHEDPDLRPYRLVNQFQGQDAVCHLYLFAVLSYLFGWR